MKKIKSNIIENIPPLEAKFADLFTKVAHERDFLQLETKRLDDELRLLKIKFFKMKTILEYFSQEKNWIYTGSKNYEYDDGGDWIFAPLKDKGEMARYFRPHLIAEECLEDIK